MNQKEAAMASFNIDDVIVELIDNEHDVLASFDILCETFGRQTSDGFFLMLHPDWQTSEGQTRGAIGMKNRWKNVGKDANGNLDTIFLKATIPSSEDSGKRKMVGFTIWEQASQVSGIGKPPIEDFSQVEDLEKIYPGDPASQKYLCQLFSSLHRRRIELSKEVASSASPALMVLDLCCVYPDYQRRGIAQKLVQWGLDEAKRRGGQEAVTEASSAGKHAYVKLGFKAEGGEIEFVGDEEFKNRSPGLPPNLFMRTGRPIV